MATQTKNLNLSVFDFATDSTPAFVNGVAGLNDSNMHKIDEAIHNMNVDLQQTKDSIYTLDSEIIAGLDKILQALV